MDANEHEEFIEPHKSKFDDESQYPSVVMIDDDADDHYLLRTVLKNSHPNYRVIPIYDSSQVLSQLKALQVLPAFLLLDLNMPLKNGFEVLEEVRSDRRYTTLPIIVFTSSSNPADLIRCQELGATDYVEKPATYQDLQTIIDRTWRFWLEPPV